MQQSLATASSYLYNDGTGWSFDATMPRGTVLVQNPAWDSQGGAGTPVLGGTSVVNSTICDLTPVGVDSEMLFIYIPVAASLAIVVDGGAAVAGGSLEAEIVSFSAGEFYTTLVRLDPAGNAYTFQGLSAYSTITAGAILDQTGKTTGFTVPSGFVALRQLRIGADVTNAVAIPTIKFGYTTGGTLAVPAGTVSVLLPLFPPPEFQNSTVPYMRTKLNSSAALFSNVGAALYKEGTILAARLKPSTADFYGFTRASLNAVHPALRYYGPLEKGLYCFTNPTGEAEALRDRVINLPSISALSLTRKPLFDFAGMGMYDAIMFSDMGNAVDRATLLAVSVYTHLEFETSSSLFDIGVSSLPLETLHAAEVALLKFGHFHENPIHWAAIASAVRAAVAHVAPIVAPYARAAGSALLSAGAARIQKALGDRTMRQATIVMPARVKAAPVRPKKRPQNSRTQKKRK